jgi:hypothetical protein
LANHTSRSDSPDACSQLFVKANPLQIHYDFQDSERPPYQVSRKNEPSNIPSYQYLEEEKNCDHPDLAESARNVDQNPKNLGKSPSRLLLNHLFYLTRS